MFGLAEKAKGNGFVIDLPDPRSFSPKDILSDLMLKIYLRPIHRFMMKDNGRPTTLCKAVQLLKSEFD